MSDLQLMPQMSGFACRLASADDDLSLPHIEVHCKSQKCLSCKSTHRWSEVYEAQTKGKVRQLLPAATPSSVPVDYFYVPVLMPTDNVICCHACINAGISQDQVYSRWRENMTKRVVGFGGAALNEQPTKKVPTLDDL